MEETLLHGHKNATVVNQNILCVNFGHMEIYPRNVSQKFILLLLYLVLNIYTNILINSWYSYKTLSKFIVMS